MGRVFRPELLKVMQYHRGIGAQVFKNEKVGRPCERHTSSARCNGRMRSMEAIRTWKLEEKEGVGAGIDAKFFSF